MKRTKKICIFLICLLVLQIILSGCAGKQEIVQDDKDLHIYTSFYPLYALTEALLKDIPDTYLHCLAQPQDGCLRDYQLSDWDLALLTRSADLVIIGGRGLESYENALYSLGESGPAVAAVLYNQELAPPMLENAENDISNHWQDSNPHLYMDPKGAILIAESIAAQLMTVDPANADAYMRNLESAENILQSIIEDIKQTSVYNSGEKVILMNEAAVYIAQSLGLQIEMCVERDSGEAYYDYELEKLISELQNCESRIILIEKQAPERFFEALEAAGFRLARIDTLSTKRTEEGFEGYIQALKDNIAIVSAVLQTKMK